MIFHPNKNLINKIDKGRTIEDKLDAIFNSVDDMIIAYRIEHLDFNDTIKVIDGWIPEFIEKGYSINLSVGFITIAHRIREDLRNWNKLYDYTYKLAEEDGDIEGIMAGFQRNKDIREERRNKLNEIESR